MYEITNINTIRRHILPNNLIVTILINDIRIKSSLKINQILIFTKKSFFFTILRFVQSCSGELGDIDGFIQSIPGSFKSDDSIDITGIDKKHLKCDCIDGSIVNGIGEPILYSFALFSPRSHEIF